MNVGTNVWLEDNEDNSAPFHRPTEAEYLEAKEAAATFAKWIVMSRNKQTELIDDLARERENEKTYTALYEQKKEIYRMYEICNEIEKNTKSKTRKKNDETSNTDKHST
jgi:hypothetical protein